MEVEDEVVSLTVDHRFEHTNAKPDRGKGHG
jgi:hypothetical protein